MKPIPPAWRDTILFLTGLGLLIFEVVIRSGEPRWGFLPMYGWMMGLPVMLRKDDPSPSAPPPASSGPPSLPGEITP